MRAQKTVGVLERLKEASPGTRSVQGGVKCCLPLIPLLNMDQVVGVPKEQFGENPGVTQRLKGQVDQGKWVFFFQL